MVDLTSFAVLRSLADADDLGLGGPLEALVDIGARVTNIVVHEGGVPRFVRILLMGGQDVTEAVAERTGHPQAAGRGAQAASSACSGTTATRWTAGGWPSHGAAGTAFVDEVRGSLDYYAASSRSRRPSDAHRAHRRRLASRAAWPSASPTPPASPSSTGPPFAVLSVRQDRPDARADPVRRAAGRVPVGLALGAADEHHDRDRGPSEFPRVNLLPPEIAEAAAVPSGCTRSWP